MGREKKNEMKKTGGEDCHFKKREEKRQVRNSEWMRKCWGMIDEKFGK